MKRTLGTILFGLTLVVCAWNSTVAFAQSATPTPESAMTGEPFVMYGDIVEVNGNVIVVEEGDEQLVINVTDETIIVGELAAGAMGVTIEGYAYADGSYDAVQLIIDSRYELCTLLFVGDCYAYIEGIIVTFSDDQLVVDAGEEQFTFTLYPNTPVNGGTLAIGEQVGVLAYVGIVDNNYVLDGASDISILNTAPVPTQEPCASGCSLPSGILPPTAPGAIVTFNGTVVEFSDTFVVLELAPQDQITITITSETIMNSSFVAGLSAEIETVVTMSGSHDALNVKHLDSNSETRGNNAPLTVALSKTAVTSASLLILLSTTMLLAMGTIVVKRN